MSDELERGMEALRRDRERRMAWIRWASVGFGALLIGWRIAAALFRPSVHEITAAPIDVASAVPRQALGSGEREAFEQRGPSCRALLDEDERLRVFGLVGDPKMRPQVCSATARKRWVGLVAQARLDCRNDAAVERLRASIAAACPSHE
jgi:hypothetical protein